MAQFLAVESSTGEFYQVSAKDSETAYRVIGKKILNMPGTDDPNFDTGNVDFDLYEIKKLPLNETLKLEL